MPKFVGTYDNTQAYEALSVVDNGSGTSYVANQPVPAGTPLTNTTYWAVYGSTNGEILNLQQQIDDMKDPNVSGSLQDQINDNSSDILALTNYTAKVYDTIADMQADTAPAVGTLVKTKGYYNIDDGGDAFYVISDTASGFYETIGDKYAIMAIDTFLNVKACGVKGNFETNSNAILTKISTFLTNSEYASNDATGDQYYGNNIKLVFPKDKYKINFSTGANRFDIIGNNSIIDGDGGIGIAITGTCINIDGFSFINCSNAIKYDGANLEAGWFNVTNCKFYKTTDDAIQIDGTQSYIGTIDRCLFFKCKHSLNIKHYADHFTINECWISVPPMTVDGDANILFGDIGELYIDKCLFVPTGMSSNNIVCAYVKCSGNCVIIDSHFGGEAGSLPILITDVVTKAVTTGLFTIKDCPQTYSQNNGRALVIIKSPFTKITIDNCIGFYGVQKPIRFITGYSPSDVSYGDIVLLNVRGDYPIFSDAYGMMYRIGCKFLQEELYPFLICDKHITEEGLNLDFNNLTIVGHNNDVYGSGGYPSRWAQIHALVRYQDYDSNNPTLYYSTQKEITINCYKEGTNLIYKTDFEDYVTITNNATDTQDTNITLVPTAKCNNLTIVKVWSDTWSNKNETLLFPNLY